MNRTIKTGAVLIAIYLGVRYATGSGTLIKSGAAGASSVIKSFQGR